ncbi:MAG: hypothetical protein O3B13_25385 [Planctomycetota bacterium]|nr:hypothetical protein [Planctomycetota bacterium]
MIRLKDAHQGERAVVVLPGPSLIESGFDFAALQGRGLITFLDTKALTPRVLESGFVPDYFLMPFPEKAQDNSLQHFVYRSFLAGSNIEGLLQAEHRGVAREMRRRFDEYFETWRPERGPHKRYRMRPDVYLRDSPYDLLPQMPRPRIIANGALLKRCFPRFPHSDRTCYFGQDTGQTRFELEKYFAPVERDDVVLVRCVNAFLNSAAIAMYPLLRYMGFREVYFLGMDMSMLGSLEYAAPYTFRSMAHFWWFFRRSRHVFNANYKANGWFFRRPQSEFHDLRMLWQDAPLKFTRVYEPWRYSTPVDGIPTISSDEFLKL